MKKINLLIFFLTIYSSGFSQKIAQNIEWKAGESKQIVVRVNGKEIKNGVTTKDTTLTTKSELFVQEVTDDNYFIDYKMENQLVNLGRHFYSDLLHELKSNAYIEANIKINKNSLTSDILNKEEFDTNLSNSRDEIIEILKIKVPEKVEQATTQLDELLKTVEQSGKGLQMIDLILNSYTIQYSKGDTLVTMDSTANPFNLQGFNGAKVVTYFEETKDLDTFNIVVEKSYDFDTYKDLMLGYSDQVTGKMVADKSVSEATNQMDEMLKKLLKSYEFEASESFVITRQSDSNWPLKLLKKTDLKMNTKSNESAAFMDILIEIK